MSIQTKDQAQGKADKKLDRVLNKQKKFVPLMERNFNELHTLAEQFEYLKRKQRQKDNEITKSNKS